MSENQSYKVWCLSLESNTDRREWMLSIKDKIGLDFQFWNATTPDEITDEIKERYFKDVNYYEWDVIPEAVMATFISHMKILKWAADNQTNVIVIEDDIDIVNAFDWDSLEWISLETIQKPDDSIIGSIILFREQTLPESAQIDSGAAVSCSA